MSFPTRKINNIVDERYDHPGKRYLDVEALFQADGEIIPVSFLWENEDGSVKRYEIDRILGHCRRASMKAGGVGECYTVMVRGEERNMYLEMNRWFIEVG